jgi:cell fate regulator YaaT (PSP1 superfamily)
VNVWVWDKTLPHHHFRNECPQSHYKHQAYNKELPLAIARMRMQVSNKGNVVLYLDKELVEKTRELGFNLSKTFENHLKQLINSFSNVNSLNKGNPICFVGNSG